AARHLSIPRLWAARLGEPHGYPDARDRPALTPPAERLRRGRACPPATPPASMQRPALRADHSSKRAPGARERCPRATATARVRSARARFRAPSAGPTSGPFPPSLVQLRAAL